MELTYYPNLKMMQVCEHQGVPNELNTRFLIFNKTNSDHKSIKPHPVSAVCAY